MGVKMTSLHYHISGQERDACTCNYKIIPKKQQNLYTTIITQKWNIKLINI